jgi:cobalamin biosynthesis Mg chelatase CobN
MEEMGSMDVKVVIPGHGNPGGKETIGIMLNYIESIENIVKEMKNEKKSFEDLVKVQIPERYKDWWLGDYFLSNLKFLFNANLTNLK